MSVATELLIARIDAVFIDSPDKSLLLACRDALLEMQAVIEQQAPIIDEVHRRADKECCEEDQCDFTVTVTYEDYMALLS